MLILSEFAGAAQTLGSGAILINPFNTAEVSQATLPQQQRVQQQRRQQQERRQQQAIFDALHMDKSEREERHVNMIEYVNKARDISFSKIIMFQMNFVITNHYLSN